MLFKDVLIGSDPELFIYDQNKSQVISSIGLIPGEKGNAFKPEGYAPGYGLQIDNILGEFNIPPTNVKEEFINSILTMKQYIIDFVKRINPNYTILCKASELINPDQLQSEEAKLFGCSPDFNVWTLSQNPRPQGDITNLRTTGCHIHIGYDSPTVEKSIALVQVLDLFLGIPSLFIDKDVRRRSLYGKAGSFRFTTYGVEYRVLSGYFINHPILIEWMFNNTMAAIEFLQDDNNLRVLTPQLETIINTNDLNQAYQYIQNYNINIPNI